MSNETKVEAKRERLRRIKLQAGLADLRARIRALADEWDQDDHLTYYCDRFVNDLRALVGEEWKD